MKENKKFQSKKKDNNKGKRRDEPLSTSIGDLLKSKGFEMPKANLATAEVPDPGELIDMHMSVSFINTICQISNFVNTNC